MGDEVLLIEPHLLPRGTPMIFFFFFLSLDLLFAQELLLKINELSIFGSGSR